MTDAGLLEVFTSLAKDFGLFVALVVALIWLGREAVKWIIPNVVVPAIQKHLKFVDDLSASYSRFDTAIVKVVETQERLAESQDAILHKLDEMDSRPSRVRKPVDAPALHP